MTSSLPIVGQAQGPQEHVPGPLERKLAELWPVARARVWTFAYARETWTLVRRYQLKFLDVGQLKVAVPFGQVPDCEECTDICCTGPNAIVSLRLRDIAALVDAGLGEHITMERPAPPPARSKASTWARREADGSDFARAFPVLVRDRTGTCSLLTEERTCSVWPSWPLSCARYPYALDLQSKAVFWAKGCQSHKLVTSSDAPVHVRRLLRAVVDAYNERIKDAVLVHVARKELDELGLLKFLNVNALPR